MLRFKNILYFILVLLLIEPVVVKATNISTSLFSKGATNYSNEAILDSTDLYKL